jgi:hypothetical protein
VIEFVLPRKTSKLILQEPVPETDTGGWVEYTKALEITAVKELNTLPP